MVATQKKGRHLRKKILGSRDLFGGFIGLDLFSVFSDRGMARVCQDGVKFVIEVTLKLLDFLIREFFLC